ncbi:MAG: hypothetical protein ACYDEO_04510 [Aggregatilineales bacterium]
MKRHPRADFDLRGLLVITLSVFSVLVIGGAVLAVYLFARSTQGSGGPNDLTILTMPYNVNLRPLPAPEDQALLPPTVGPFTRQKWSSTLKANVLTGQATATYVNGPAAITIRVVLEANNIQAENDLTKLVASVNWPKPAFQQIDNAGYFEATDPAKGTVRFICARRYWLFDETASSQAALDTFVKAFAY